MASSAGPVNGNAAPATRKPLTLRQSGSTYSTEVRLNAAIFADAFIEGTELEGGQGEDAVKHLKPALENFKANSSDPHKVDDVLAILNSCTYISEESLHKLPIGAKILFRGGWAASYGNSGHVILYLFERASKDTFNITIFNTGSGAEYHDGSVGDFLAPVQKYAEVPEYLLANDSCGHSFCDRAALLTSRDWERGYNWNGHPPKNAAAYLYTEWFSKWKSYKVHDKSPVLMKGQKSGTCYYRAFLALIKNYLSEKDYKRFKYYSKKDALFQLYENARLIEEITPTECLLIKESAEKLLRTIGKLYCPDDTESNLLSFEEVQNTKLRVIEILQEMEKLSKPSAKEEPQLLDQWQVMGVHYDYDKDDDIEPSHAVLHELFLPKPQELLNVLTQTTEYFKTIAEDGDVISFQIEKFVDLLPMPDSDYWNGVPQEQIVAILDKLYLLMLFYYKHNQSDFNVVVEQQNVILSLLATIYLLSCKKDATLALYGLDVKYFLKNFTNNTPFVCFDKKAFEKKLKLVAFLQDANKKQLSFCFVTEDYVEYLKTKNIQNVHYNNNIAHARGVIHGLNPEEKERVATVVALDDQVLQETKLEHIRFLRQAEAAARLFCDHRDIVLRDLETFQTDTPLEIDIVDIGGYSSVYISKICFKRHECTQGHPVMEEREDISYNDSLRHPFRLYRQGHKNEFNQFIEGYDEDRTLLGSSTYNFGREGNIRASQGLHLDRDLGSATVHQKLRPNEVLSYFRRNFSKLSSFYQTIFDYLLFQPCEIEKVWQVPLYDEAQKESFLRQCIDFIAEGLKYCFEMHAGKIDVYKALFFIRFCDRIKMLNPKAALPSVEEAIENLLKLSYIDDFERRAIHLQRIFHYSTLPPGQLSDAMLKQIIFSWFYFNKCPSDPAWDDPYLFWQVKRFMHFLSPVLESKMQGDFRDSVLEDLWRNIVKEEKCAVPWTGNFPLFERGDFKFNIVKAQIHSGKKVLSPPFGTINTSDPHYRKLFQNELFTLTPVAGGFFSFDHPRFGKIRLRKKSAQAPLEIYRLMQGEWCRAYFLDSDRSPLPIPYVFSGKEYACFVTYDERVYIEPIDREIGPSYLIMNGFRHDVEVYELDDQGNPKYKVQPRTLCNFEEFFFFSGFTTYNIRNGEAKKEDMKVTKFPRYKSLATGHTLSFSGPTMQWEENSSFALQRVRPPGLLGKVRNHYLYLRDDKTQREKILVPMQKVMQKVGCRLVDGGFLHDDSIFGLDVDEVRKSYNDGQIPLFLRAQIGVYKFIEFDVKDGEFVPISTEGILFKAYLLLVQRNYSEAKALINSIAHYESLSQDSIEILQWIVSQGEISVDFSPSAAAVRLSAAFLLYKDPTDGIADVYKDLNKSINKDLRNYRRSYSSIVATVRLNKAEQDFWSSVNFGEGTLAILPNRLTHYETSRQGAVGGTLALQQGRDESFEVFKEYFDAELVDGESSLEKWNFPKSDDDAYAASLDLEYKEFEKDYEAGHDKNNTKTRFTIPFGKDFEKFYTELSNAHSAQKKAVDEEKIALLLFANKSCPNAEVALRNEVLEKGHYLASLDINDLVNLFLLGNPEEYAKASPYLTQDEIRELDQRIQHFLLAALKEQKLKRALELPQSSKEIANLGAELAAPLTHDIAERALLVFEYRANILLHLDQSIKIKRMLESAVLSADDPEHVRFKNLTLQMMMGGGKTSVLASIWLYMASRVPGRLAVFIPPTSQFETLRLTLGRAQKRNFKQEVLPVKLSLEDMSLANLKKLERQIQGTIASQGILLITKETLQTLELDLAYLLEHPSEQVEKLAKENEQKRICLVNILRTIREKGDFLIDESDLLLSPNLEVNLPVATPSHVKYEFITLIETIYKLHVSQLIKYNGKSIDEIIGLTRNAQNTLDLNFYKTELQPLIAKELYNAFPDFAAKIPEKYQNAFLRYVCGQMTSQNQTEQDKEFIAYLKTQAGGNDEEKQLADQIALAKFFFVKILPLTLTRSTGRSYGRSPQYSNGKVVPYLGVDCPSPTTEFGSPWIAAAYHFQTVLSSGISLSQVKSLVERFAKLAEQEASKKHCSIDATKAAERFSKVSGGRKIERVAGDDKEMKALCEYLNNSLEDRLALERETVAETVQYYKSYLGSTAQDFVFQCNTVRTFSGTPWNHHCYGAGLDKDENLALEMGIEGSIVDKMLRKAQDKDLLHEVTEVSIASVLDPVVKSAGKRVQSLIDAGGIFKDFDNERVARSLAEYFKDNPKIEYILFFGRKDPSEATPDHLMAFQRGSSTPVFLGSTDKEELKKRGITRENVFIYFDEKHSEATDLPLCKEGRGVVTISARMDLRTLLQSIMRLREFFSEQDVEYVVPKGERELFFNRGAELRDCVTTLLRNQGERKTDQAYQSARQRIRAFVRNFAVNKVLAMKVPEQVNLYASKYKGVFKSELSDSPYNDYGILDEEVAVELALHRYATTELDRFKDLNDADRKYLEDGIDAIIAGEKQKGRLPAKVPGNESAVDFQVAIEQEAEVVLETELQQELERYNNVPNSFLFREVGWNDATFMRSLSTIRDAGAKLVQETHPVLFKLTNLLKEGYRKYDMPYSLIFDDNIAISQNLALTYNEIIPVFSTAQKRAEQILVIKEEGVLRYVLLSVLDADFVKEWLERNPQLNMWLFLADHTQISNNGRAQFSEEETRQLNRMFLQVNIFNGNIAYLDSNENAFKEFLKDKNNDDKELIFRFLKLKAEKDNVQRSILYNSLVKCCSEWTTQLQPQDLPFIPPIDIPKVSSKWYYKLKDPAQIRAVPPEKVVFLIPAQYKYLTNDQIKGVPANKIHHLTPEQIQYLTAGQIRDVPLSQIYFLTPAQIPYMSDKQVDALNKAPAADDRAAQERWQNLSLRREIINAVSKEQLHLLYPANLNMLGEGRVNDVPDDKIGHLSKEQLQQLKKAKLNKVPRDRYGDLDSKQFKDLEQPQVADIPPQYVQHLTIEQISWLTTTAQFDEVSPGWLQYLGDKLKLRHKVDDIPDDLLCRLEQFQIGRLTDANKINAVPAEPHKMPMWLGPRDVPAPNMLSWLDIYQLRQLKKERLPDVPPDKLTGLSDEQIQMLDKAMVNKVPPECYGKFAPGQFKDLEQPRVEKISPEYVPHLAPAQIPWLTTIPQFNQVVPENLQYLGENFKQRTEVDDVPDDLLHLLSTEQVKRLYNVAKIGQLRDANQIQALEDMQIEYLSFEAMKKLSPAQKEYVRKMRDAEAITHGNNLLRFKYSKGLGLRIHKVVLRILQFFLFFVSFFNSIKEKRVKIDERCGVKTAIIERLKNIPRAVPQVA